MNKIPNKTVMMVKTNKIQEKTLITVLECLANLADSFKCPS